MSSSSRSECICNEKGPAGIQGDSDSWSYPQWKDGGDNLSLFQKHGYFIVRNLISQEEIEEAKGAISSIVQKWFQQLKSSDANEEKDWEEIANRYKYKNATTINNNNYYYYL